MTAMRKTPRTAADVGAIAINGQDAEFRLRTSFAFTDFLSQTTTQQPPWTGVSVTGGSNTVAPASGVVTSDHPGVVLLRSTATTNSGYAYVSSFTMIRIGGGERFDLVFWTPAAFTNVLLRFGFLDSANQLDPADGCYFELNNSANIIGKCADNSVRTSSATVAALSTSTWYHARVTVNANASQVDFAIYDMAGALVGTQAVTANIPTGAARLCGCGLGTVALGTTAQDLVALDYMSVSLGGGAMARGAA